MRGLGPVTLYTDKDPLTQQQVVAKGCRTEYGCQTAVQQADNRYGHQEGILFFGPTPKVLVHDVGRSVHERPISWNYPH